MIRFSTFIEGETREWSPADSMGDAVRKVRDERADGLTVDLRDEFCQVSYEVIPGRSIGVYYDDDCYNY